MNTFHKITDTIDSYRNEMIDMQIKLCSFPAISPASGGEGETKKAEFLLEFLKNGASTHNLTITRFLDQKPIIIETKTFHTF